MTLATQDGCISCRCQRYASNDCRCRSLLHWIPVLLLRPTETKSKTFYLWSQDHDQDVSSFHWCPGDCSKITMQPRALGLRNWSHITTHTRDTHVPPICEWTQLGVRDGHLSTTYEQRNEVQHVLRSQFAEFSPTFSSLRTRQSDVWRSSTLSLKIKLDLYTSLIVSTAIYASETWKSTARIRQQLDVFQQRNLRKVLVLRARTTWRIWRCKAGLDSEDYRTL